MLRRWAIGLALVLGLSTPTLALDRYAKTAASGTGDCLTLPNACTIQTCLAAMTSGDRCLLDNGVYPWVSLGGSDARCTPGKCTLEAINLHGAEFIDLNPDGRASVINGGGKDNWVMKGLYIHPLFACPVAAIALDGHGEEIKQVKVEIPPTCGAVGVYGPWTGAGSGNASSYLIQDSSFAHYPGCVGAHYRACDSTSQNSGTNCDANPSICSAGSASCVFCNGTDQGGSCDMLTSGNDGFACWSLSRYTTVTIERSQCKYARNSNIKNTETLNFRRNYTLNQCNHGQILSDVDNLTMENNIYDVSTDVSPHNCLDDWNVGDLMDTYCLRNAVIRNNTLVGHNKAREGFYFFNNGSAGPSNECIDVFPPNIGAANLYGNIKIYNNLFVDNDPTSPSSAISFNWLALDGGFGVTNLTTRNNIFVDWHSAPTGSNGVFATSVTDAQTNRDWDGDGVKEEIGSQQIDISPTFFFDNYEAHDYNLADGSPAIAAGVNSGGLVCPAEDYNGATRITCDVGALTNSSSNICGDGRVSPGSGEVCDGANMNGKTCVTYGFSGGSLLCTNACTVIDTGGCITRIGDKRLRTKTPPGGVIVVP